MGVVMFLKNANGAVRQSYGTQEGRTLWVKRFGDAEAYGQFCEEWVRTSVRLNRTENNPNRKRIDATLA